jgi:hypothetical protein
MQSPEERMKYHRLSAMLQAVGQSYYQEFPTGTVALSLRASAGRIVVEALDQKRKSLGTVPNSSTTPGLRDALEREFANVTSSDGEIRATIANPMEIKAE